MLYSLAMHFYALFYRHFGLRVPKSKKDLVLWFHAVSVGETKAIAPLIAKAREDYPNAEIYLTSITKTGHAEAQKISQVDYCSHLPVDIPYLMRRFIKRMKPDLLILSETDYWPAMLRYAPRTILVNGKLSERSFRRHNRLSSRIFHQIDHFCVQAPIYKERFEALGIDPAKITVTGNLKFDQQTEPIDPAFKRDLKLTEPPLTIGSTHDPEEKELLSRLRHIPKILLVPRHPERFDKVEALLKRMNFHYGRYSKGLSGDEQVILIDQMGLLNQCYAISKAAIVAGSFTPKVGGHNILEPLRYNIPTFFGPYMGSQADMADLVLTYDAGIQTTLDDLPGVVGQVPTGAKRLLSDLSGSLERTWELTIKTLQGYRLDSLSRGGAVVSSSGS